MRMRLTMSGLALAASIAGCKLPALRPLAKTRTSIAAA
jgi:hypothetical protein